MPRSNFVGLDAQQGEIYRAERRNAGPTVSVPPDGYVTRVGVPSVDDADLASRQLAGDLRDLMEDVVDDGLAGAERSAAFLPRASDLAYERLRPLAGDILTSQDFWRYLALVRLYEVIDWWYPADSGDRWGTNPSQFNRCMPLSLFVRGQVSCELADEDRGVVDSVNDVDVWTSHVVAVLYGTAPQLVVEYFRVLVGWQSRGTGEFSELRRDQLRELARLLTAARSNVVFDLASSETCRDLVAGLVPEAVRLGQERYDIRRRNRARAANWSPWQTGHGN